MTKAFIKRKINNISKYPIKESDFNLTTLLNLIAIPNDLITKIYN